MINTLSTTAADHGQVIGVAVKIIIIIVPFGTVFPIEVQNRILWMTWKGDHKDKAMPFLIELRTLPSCKLTDWISKPGQSKIFHNA